MTNETEVTTLLSRMGIVAPIRRALHGPFVVLLLSGPTSVWNLIHGTPRDPALCWNKWGTTLLRKSLLFRAGYLSEYEVREIRASYWQGERSGADLGRSYSLDRISVWRIVHGLTYWWV